MARPLEIQASPLSAYIAAARTAAPKIQDAPGAAWSLIGTSGTNNMTEDGIVITHGQEFYDVNVAGSTVVQKVFRTAETLSVAFTIYDIKAEEYSRTLNFNTVTATAAASGVAGQKKVNLYRGIDVPFRALLLRGVGMSPEQEDANLQYYIPLAYHNGSPEVVYTKGEAAGLNFEFMALFDNQAPTGEGLGTFIYQTATAT